jgi:hypothetical protein
MPLMPSRIALVVALGLASPSFAATLITPQQAQATIAQNGFTPVGQPGRTQDYGRVARNGANADRTQASQA